MMDILVAIKALLGITDDSQDTILQYHIQSVVDAILNYCCIDELPRQLESTVISKVVSIHKAIEDERKVQTITRGNTTITYTQKNTTVPDIVSDITSTLNRFRKGKIR